MNIRRAGELNEAQRVLAAAKEAELAKAIAESRSEAAKAIEHTRELDLDLARQRERTADAERRLEVERGERIKLDTRTANRWLTSEEVKSLETAMGKFSGQPVEVVVFPVNFESVALADLIHGILGNAKWRVGLSARRLTEAPQLPTPAGTMASLGAQGVYIRSSGDEASRTAGRALYDALSTTAASGVYDPTPLPGEPRVFVLVGDKPTPTSVSIDK